MSNEYSQMMQIIIDNLTTTFQNSGTDNEKIHQSEEILFSLSQSANFYPILFDIIQSDSLPLIIKKSSLIYLQNLIKSNFILIPESSRQFILINYPILIKKSLQFLSIHFKLSENLVNCAYFNGNWPNLLEIIHSSFFQFESDNEQAFASIILLNAISKHYKKSRYDDEQATQGIDILYPFLIKFIELSLNQIFDNRDQNYLIFLPFVSICYKTIKFLNFRSLSQYFIENSTDLSQLLYQTTKMSMIENDFPQLDHFLYFAKHSIKFCAKIIQKYPDHIDPSFAIQLVQSLLIFFPKFQNNEFVLNSVARLIHSLIHFPPTYQFIMSDCGPDFVLKIILPYYILNQQDAYDSINDVPQFLAKFQTQNFFFESEYRAYLYESISDLTRKLRDDKTIPHLSELILMVFQSYLENYSKESPSDLHNSTLFSFLFLFSSIADEIPCLSIELISSLFCNLSRLLLSDSHLVISGVLICLKTISFAFCRLKYSSPLFESDVYGMVIRLLTEHPSLLVRYYASIAFSEIIDQVYNSDDHTILEMCSSYLPQIIKTYLELSSEFHDPEFIMLISTILEVFGSLLIEISPDLIKELFSMFMNYQNTSSFILNTLEDFIELLFHAIDENNLPIEREQIISPLLESIAMALEISTPEQLPIETLHLLFGFVAKLASLYGGLNNEQIRSPTSTETDYSFLFSYDHLTPKQKLSPIFWNLVEMIPSIISNYGDEIVEDAFFALRNIFINDLESALTPEKLEFTLNLCFHYIEMAEFHFSDELYASFLLLSVVFRFTPSETIPDIVDKYKYLLDFIQNGFEETESWTYSSLLFLSMLIQNSPIAFELLETREPNATSFSMMWADISEYPTIMLFIMNYFHLFTNDFNCELIKKALMSHKNWTELNHYDDFDTSSLQISLLMFNPDEILAYFKQFVQSSEVYSSLLLEIQSEFAMQDEEEDCVI